MNQWINESMNPWIIKSMNQWINESMNQWINELMNQWINESMNQWINESMNQWINESMNQWINESMNHQSTRKLWSRDSITVSGISKSWNCSTRSSTAEGLQTITVWVVAGSRKAGRILVARFLMDSVDVLPKAYTKSLGKKKN